MREYCKDDRVLLDKDLVESKIKASISNDKDDQRIILFENGNKYLEQNFTSDDIKEVLKNYREWYLENDHYNYYLFH